jgi:hypothetical protein
MGITYGSAKIDSETLVFTITIRRETEVAPLRTGIGNN